MLKLLCVIIIFLSCPLAVWASGNVPVRQAHQGIEAGKAPNFTLPVYSGGMKSFYDESKGRKTILFFWATWCPHCHEQLGQFEKDKALIQQQGIKVVLVNLGQSREEIASFINASQMDIDTFIDADSVLLEPYQIIGVPTFFFIDAQGIIKQVTHALPEDYTKVF